MLRKIKNTLLYAGLSKDEYDEVISDINNANRMMINVFSGLAAVMIAVMCLLTVLMHSTAANRHVYIVGDIASLLLFMTSYYYSKKHEWVVTILVYVAFSIFFLYGIFIGTITNPTQQTVTFMVMLVFLPVLFIDRPIRVIAATIVYVLVFIGLCFGRKTEPVLSTDIMDAIIYGVLGAATGAIINQIKVRNFVLMHKLFKASRYDQLTMMNNRNSFESDLACYPDRCSRDLSCIYIDVNGLHELNNTKGHHQGDIMLQFVAVQVRDAFGAEYTYRIGGDEFVAFAPDIDNEELKSRLSAMNESIEKQGYHVAVGFADRNRDGLVMDELIKAAEAEMYRAKREFYSSSAFDRRRRSSD